MLKFDKGSEIWNQNLRRLPLGGTCNTRDLGGYPCAGGITRWHVFLRADCPHALTAEDVASLIKYGVTLSLDLRSQPEVEYLPSMMEKAAGVCCKNISLSDRLEDADYEGDAPGTMSGLYISILEESKSEVIGAMKILAASEGAALFHCAVGKDRTGVVAMLLLGIAGVEFADIVADYSISDIYMRNTMSYVPNAPTLTDADDFRAKSKPASMWRALRHMEENYGSVENYLLRSGMNEDEIATIREKFIDKF